MARKLKVSVAVMNLRIHPHTPGRYVSLFKETYRLKSPAQIHGDRYGMISTLDLRRSKDGVVRGVFTTFTQIDTHGLWFDADHLQEADVDQVAKIHIPAALHPNSAAYFFHFDVNSHRLYVESYSQGKALTPRSIQRLMVNLFAAPELLRQFGEPSVSIVQTKASLEALFGIDRIRKIEILLEKPNADVFADDFEEEIEKHLLEAHSKRLTISYEAEVGQSVVATPPIRRVGGAALDNGEVRVTGRDNGAAVTKSSADFPQLLQGTYDPDLTSGQQAFDRLIPKKD